MLELCYPSGARPPWTWPCSGRWASRPAGPPGPGGDGVTAAPGDGGGEEGPGNPPSGSGSAGPAGPGGETVLAGLCDIAARGVCQLPKPVCGGRGATGRGLGPGGAARTNLQQGGRRRLAGRTAAIAGSQTSLAGPGLRRWFELNEQPAREALARPWHHGLPEPGSQGAAAPPAAWTGLPAAPGPEVRGIGPGQRDAHGFQPRCLERAGSASWSSTEAAAGENRPEALASEPALDGVALEGAAGDWAAAESSPSRCSWLPLYLPESACRQSHRTASPPAAHSVNEDLDLNKRVAQLPPSCPPRSRSMRGTRQTASPLRRAPPGERTPGSERSGHGLRTRTDSRSPAPSCPSPAPLRKNRSRARRGPAAATSRDGTGHAMQGADNTSLGCSEADPDKQLVLPPSRGMSLTEASRGWGRLGRRGFTPAGVASLPRLRGSRAAMGSIYLGPLNIERGPSRIALGIAVRRFAPATARVEGGDGHDLPRCN